ncbi:MAG: hypothetical protein ACOYB1_15985 [Limnohabitans sp.]
MKTKKFNSWLACYLQQSENEVIKLLEDKTATQFLIAWSLLESAWFKGFAKIEDINCVAVQKAKNEEIIIGELDDFVRFFHDRYQNETLYRQLMHKQKHMPMDELRLKDFSKFSSSEKICFTLIVVYRYRNNIFHGNKGVESWLKYEECILKCIAMMQLLIPISKN